METKGKLQICRNWWRRRSIQDQIFISMLLVAVISIFVLGNVAYQKSAEAIEENYRKSYESTLRNSSRVMDMNLNTIIEVVRGFLTDKNLQDVLENGGDYPGYKFSSSDQQRIEETAEVLSTQHIWVNSIVFMDLYGHYYQLNNVNRGTYEFYQYYSAHSFLDEEWSGATKEANGKELFFGGNVMGIGDDNVFSMTKYLINPSTRQPMGYLVVNLSRRLIGRSFVVSGTSYQSNHYMVVDKSGQMVYFDGPEEVQEEIVRNYLMQETNREYVFSDVRNSTTGWNIANVIEKNELSQDSKNIRTTVFVCGGLIILLCFVCARLISRSITRPLNQLENVISRVGEGERHITEKFDDSEVGMIGSKFKEMVNTNLELSEHLMAVQLNEREAEILLLQSQINPHFLYNTLDSLYFVAIVHGDDQIADMIMALSNNFKLSLNRGNKYITVRDSVKWIREYMKLQNMRYNNRFEMEEDIQEEIMEKKTLTFILQPFVENAMYHGLEPKIGRGRIALRGWQEGQTLVFTIEDDGVGIEDLSLLEGGYGVRNVRERIRLHYGEEYGVQVESSRGAGTKVTVTVPIEK
ncbi:MAG: sensor histidine kinase [Eubacteriales bacterium]|nr:sensor histidine kinase [Eubacteriales bacterium]